MRWLLDLDESTKEISGVMDIFGLRLVAFRLFVSAVENTNDMN